MLQEELEDSVRLWVATAQPIWQEVDVKAPDAMQQASARVHGCAEVLLARAQEQGFPADKLPSGERGPCLHTCSTSVQVWYM